MDDKSLLMELKGLAKALNVSEAQATMAMGYICKIAGKSMNAKEAIQWVHELIKMKTPDQLTQDERLLCVAIGALKRVKPFISQTNKLGRNIPCPCGSGSKYKNCCLEMAKAHDYKRYYEDVE